MPKLVPNPPMNKPLLSLKSPPQKQMGQDYA